MKVFKESLVKKGKVCFVRKDQLMFTLNRKALSYSASIFNLAAEIKVIPPPPTITKKGAKMEHKFSCIHCTVQCEH